MGVGVVSERTALRAMDADVERQGDASTRARGRWGRVGVIAACAAAAGAAGAAIAATRGGAATSSLDALGTIDRREIASLGMPRGGKGAGELGEEAGGAVDAAPFAAKRGTFSYESWFKTLKASRQPGESKRGENDELIQESDGYGVSAKGGWKAIREEVAKSHGKEKVLLLLRHGHAVHNAWGDVQTEELKTLPCTWRNDQDLLDPSLTDVGVRQIVATRETLAGRDGFLRAVRGGAKNSNPIKIVSSPLSRAMETALIATSGVPEFEKPIVVTDYLRERIELNTPFEVRAPASLKKGRSMSASKAIEETKVKNCKFHAGMRQLYGDGAFAIDVETHERECRVDKLTPKSYETCSGLGLTHENDLDLSSRTPETLAGIMNRVKVVLANVFDQYDDDVVMLVTHSDWIVSALMELYPNTLGFAPKNGEVIPIVVQDKRPSTSKKEVGKDDKKENKSKKDDTTASTKKVEEEEEEEETASAKKDEKKSKQSAALAKKEFDDDEIGNADGIKFYKDKKAKKTKDDDDDEDDDGDDKEEDDDDDDDDGDDDDDDDGDDDDDDDDEHSEAALGTKHVFDDASTLFMQRVANSLKNIDVHYSTNSDEQDE